MACRRRMAQRPLCYGTGFIDALRVHLRVSLAGYRNPCRPHPPERDAQGPSVGIAKGRLDENADNGEKSQQKRTDAHDNYYRAENEGEHRRQVCMVTGSFCHRAGITLRTELGKAAMRVWVAFFLIGRSDEERLHPRKWAVAPFDAVNWSQVDCPGLEIDASQLRILLRPMKLRSARPEEALT